MPQLEKLINPKTIAVIGGGAWCEAVLQQNRKIGFSGELWPVHPTRQEVAGITTFPSVEALPSAPDAAFVGVNRHSTVQIVAQLSSMGAGGAVCFASGFMESDDGAELSKQLLDAAGDMPILGPNCYGSLNALDNVSLWPDQHGLKPVDSGVAIIMQSSNIALNLTMQRRGLPIAHLITVGNQAQLGIADIARQLLRDERVTALGLYIESFGDVRSFEALAKEASVLNKSIVAFKVGASVEARRATISHTASLAGSTAGAEALLRRLGIASVSSVATFLEALKILHCFGALPDKNIASLSCSGGEASVMADSAMRAGLNFPVLNDGQIATLKQYLSPMVKLVNPLDYHTNIWRDEAAMTNVFAAMSGTNIDLSLIVLDFPRDDTCDPSDWNIVVDAVLNAATDTGRKYGIIASMPENLPEAVALNLLENGIVPLCDFDHACDAIHAVSTILKPDPEPVLLSQEVGNLTVLSEASAKEELALAGLEVPHSVAGISIQELSKHAPKDGELLVLKGEGVAHKTEAGAVALSISSREELLEEATKMSAERFLIEEMITGMIAELLIGVVRDPAHGFVLTIAAGGTLTELLDDKHCLLLPTNRRAIEETLAGLKVCALLDGYRGGPPAHKASFIDTIMKLQSYVIANCEHIEEIEINPLICTSTRAVVADALLVKGYA
ncbi:MAG: acetate--CoA ligase family protein [Pseudomonadota bacterium]